MNNFRSGNRGGGRRDSYRRDSGRRDFGRREMYSAVCDNCGKDCQVPFRPSGDKPVYCSDCFEQQGGRDGGRPDRGNSRGYNSRGNSDRPRRDTGDRAVTELAQKVELLNTKLDTIIGLLSPAKKEEKSVPAETKPAKETAKTKKDTKTKKTSKGKTSKSK